jgi:glucosamine--fructose-6-phosphate aminotransferase (isomerizing)
VATRFEAELRAQPEALARLIDRRLDTAAEIAAVFRRDDVDFILIAARGSSDNAALYAQYVLGRAHRIPVALATPSLYTIYGQPPRLDGALVVGISQSGSSPDVVAVLEEAARQGRPTVALTNASTSNLAQVVDAVLPLEAGDEHAVAATKTFANSVGAIALLFCAVTGDPVPLRELRQMPERVEAQINLSLETVDVPALNDVAAVTVIGRGVNYATACETALKIRELSGLFVEAYSAADLLHGPVAALEPGSAVIGIAPTGPAQAPVVQTLDELRRRGARIVSIGEVASVPAETVLPLVPGVPEWLSPLTAVVPAQVTALRTAERRGRDIDNPRGLQKVTLTR